LGSLLQQKKLAGSSEERRKIRGRELEKKEKKKKDKTKEKQSINKHRKRFTFHYLLPSSLCSACSKISFSGFTTFYIKY